MIEAALAIIIITTTLIGLYHAAPIWCVVFISAAIAAGITQGLERVKEEKGDNHP